LLSESEAAAAGAILVGVSAVGVDIRGQPLGELGQIVGAMLGGQLRQVGFDLLAGYDVDSAEQLVQEPPDHPHVTGPCIPGALGGRGAGQKRRQRFTGKRAPRPKIGGLGDTAPRLAGGDVQPVSQRIGKSYA
jgi:hypothetical protein